MTYEDMDLVDFPPSFTFAKLVDREFVRWEVYKPKKIEDDIPFADHWWKYVYWIPKIKKEFYTEALKSHDMDYTILNLCLKYGMDVNFFEKHYKFFIKRMYWMRRNMIMNHIGEVP